MSKLQMHRRSMEASSEASYCERETFEDDWGSRSTLSQLEEVATQSSGQCDASALRAERDALARALAAERARAAAAARAHDARLAELHGVIAELVRRRAADRHAEAIPEEELSDECESTTQPAGELDIDADRSRTEQNDTSSALSPELAEKVDPQELPEDTDTSTQDIPLRVASQPSLRASSPPHSACEASLRLSERDSELCLSTARCCQAARAGHGSGGSCEREHGSREEERGNTRRSESRQTKLAARVRLRRTDEADCALPGGDEAWCAEAAEQLALEVCAHAGLREALAAASNDGEAFQASISACRARCARLAADARVLRCALHAATDTAHRLSQACAVQESSCVSLCSALRAADRALEVYDVLLALAETQGPGERPEERAAAERVGQQVLAALEAEHVPALGEPLLSPGPWLQHAALSPPGGGWSPAQEARLRGHAARLKAETVSLRALAPPPHFLSRHELAGDEAAGRAALAEMEAAVHMQEMLSAREQYLTSLAAPSPPSPPAPPAPPAPLLEGKTPSRRRRERHWLDAASETDL